MIMRKKLIFMLLGIAALAGCGGGGSDSPNIDVVDKYVGTWSKCDSLLGLPPALKSQYIITKLSVDSVHITYRTLGYAIDPTCTLGGFPTVVLDEAAATHKGTKTVSAKTVDKLDLSYTKRNLLSADPANIDKDIGFVNGNELSLGAIGGSNDAEGYPTGLNSLRTYTKQ
jgi:hypothetical protein